MEKMYSDKHGNLFFVSSVTSDGSMKWRIYRKSSSGTHLLNPWGFTLRDLKEEAQNDLDKYARTKKLKRYKTRHIYNLWKSFQRKFRAS